MNHQFNFNLFNDLQLSSTSTGKFPCFEMLGLAGLLVPHSLKTPLFQRAIAAVGHTHVRALHTHAYAHLETNAALQRPH